MGDRRPIDAFIEGRPDWSVVALDDYAPPPDRVTIKGVGG